MTNDFRKFAIKHRGINSTYFDSYKKKVNITQHILDDAHLEADAEREEVEKYIDSRLATLEVILNKTSDAVARGRERLAGAGDKDVLSQLANDK